MGSGLSYRGSWSDLPVDAGLFADDGVLEVRQDEGHQLVGALIDVTRQTGSLPLEELLGAAEVGDGGGADVAIDPFAVLVAVALQLPWRLRGKVEDRVARMSDGPWCGDSADEDGLDSTARSGSGLDGEATSMFEVERVVRVVAVAAIDDGVEQGFALWRRYGDPRCGVEVDAKLEPLSGPFVIFCAGIRVMRIPGTRR